MPTLILASVIAVAAGFAIRHLIKKGSSCKDCNCSCPVKNLQKEQK